MRRHPLDPVRATYDKVASDYVVHIAGELEGKPFDRHLLERVAARFQPTDLVLDIGCGPGHVSAFLHEQGVHVRGVDLSDRMLEEARKLNPGIPFEQGDMCHLAARDGSAAGVIAFYSIIHLEPAGMRQALAEFHRVLRPGGLLLLSFHIGDDKLHRDEWWGNEVSIDFFMHQPSSVAAELRSVGFEVEEILTRDAYPDVEYATRRAYILARKPERRRHARTKGSHVE